MVPAQLLASLISLLAKFLLVRFPKWVMSQLILVGKHHQASSSKPMPPHHNRHRPFAGLSSDNTCMVWSWSWEWIGELLREPK
jgi:hypothetical protein